MNYFLVFGKLVLAVIILGVGMTLVEAPTPESFLQICQHILGNIAIWLALDINIFEE